MKQVKISTTKFSKIKDTPKDYKGFIFPFPLFFTGTLVKVERIYEVKDKFSNETQKVCDLAPPNIPKELQNYEPLFLTYKVQNYPLEAIQLGYNDKLRLFF